MSNIQKTKFTNSNGDNLIILPDTDSANNGDVLTAMKYFEEIINRIDVGNVTWHIDAHGKNCVSIARKGVAKRKFLASMGIPKSNVKVCTLEKMRVYKDNQLF